MQLSFGAGPNYVLWFPLAALILLASFAYLGRKKSPSGRAPVSIARTILRGLLRTGAILCAALAVVGVKLKEQAAEQGPLLMVDLSTSVETGMGAELLKQALQLSAGSQAELLPFAGQVARAPLPLQEATDYGILRDRWGQLNVGETDLGRGLASALALSGDATVGQGRRPVLLVSDGYETRGDAADLVGSLQAAGLAIFPLVPAELSRSSERVGLSNLSVPLVAPAQKSVEIRASVQNGSAETQSGTLKILHDQRVVLEQKITIPAGQEVLVRADSDPSQDGIKKIVATFTPDDPKNSPSEERAFLAGEAREKVLLVSGSSEDARTLEPVLKDQSYQLQSVVAGGKLESLPPFQDFSAVIFNNVSQLQLPSGALQKLESAVREGLGFLMVGGNRSFGLGGFIGTRMEEILPVIMLPPQAEEKRLNVAVQLVIDKSQSMSKDQRLEFAKEASRQVVESLKDEDFIGVIAFDETPWEVVRTMEVRGNRDYAVERIGRLYPKGQTWLLPALREARRRLESVPAGRKHMIVVTDGELKDAGPIYIEDVKEARLSGITVSTVLIGGEFDFGFLRTLSEAGGGRFYSADNPSMLPRIFVEDVKIRAGEKTLKEAEEYVVRPGLGELRSSAIRAYPPLKGFVDTKAKVDANYELAVASGAEQKPLLVSWSLDKGRVVAFTSDANGRWSSGWLSWPRFAEFWSNLIDSVRPEQHAHETNVHFDLRRFVDHGSLMLDLSVFQDLGSAHLEAEVRGPDGKAHVAPMRSVARGRFEAELQNGQAGTYQVSLRATGGQANYHFTPVAFDVSGELFGERKGRGFNIQLLEQLARGTGGQVNPEPEIIRQIHRQSMREYDLRPFLLVLALILFLAEILRRERGYRLPFSAVMRSIFLRSATRV